MYVNHVDGRNSGNLGYEKNTTRRQYISYLGCICVYCNYMFCNLLRRVISVIEVKANRGLGIEKDPVRVVTQYWDMKGNLLAERDPDPQLLSDQVIWESKRLQNIIENHSKNDRNVMSRDGHATE